MGSKHKLYIVRHGQTAGNIPGVLDEKIDTPLNEVGRAQSEAVGRELKEEGIYPIIVTSPWTRSLQSAKIIKDFLGDVPLKIDDDLRSWEHGNIKYAIDLEPYQKDWNLVPPEGEPYRDFAPRVKRLSKYWLEQIPHVLVTHSKVLYLLRYWLGDTEFIATGGKPDPGSISEIKSKFKTGKSDDDSED
jgi:broad specificity phosphatase PhoE